MDNHDTISSKVGTRLLFENERVRVWDLQLDPGQGTGLHLHTSDYLYVVIGDGRLQGVDEHGHPKEPRSMADGDVVFQTIDEPTVHGALNVGTRPWRNIVVELKD